MAMGLATFHVDPQRRDDETDDAFFERVTSEMLTGLQPGAPLQKWDSYQLYELTKSHSFEIGTHMPGHSPVFEEYIGPPGIPTGIVVIDQHGNSDYSAYNPDFPLLGGVPIWISANWEE